MKGTDVRPDNPQHVGEPFGHRAAEEPSKLYGAAPERKREDIKSSGRYRLLGVHALADGTILEAGTIVGTDTPYPWPGDPTQIMAGEDDASREKVNELHRKLYGRDALWHAEEMDLARHEAERTEEQRKVEESSEPVSAQQAWERGHEKFRDEPLNVEPATQRFLVPRMVVGDRTPANVGPATPDADIHNPKVEENLRPTKPLQESMPKEGAAGGGTQQPKKD